MRLDIPGEEYTMSWQDFLQNQKKIRVAGKKVAVLGGGAVAADCATTAKRLGALSVELIYRRKQENMPLTQYERDMLLEHGIEISSCCKPIAVDSSREAGQRLSHRPDDVAEGQSAAAGELCCQQAGVAVCPRIRPRGFRDWQPAQDCRSKKTKGIFYAGDMVLGSSTVVESVASGKNAAVEADAFIRGEARPRIQNRAKSRVVLAGTPLLPVPIDAEFFGRKIRSPFLLSAAPHTDGYEQMRLAYEHGWSGGVMKTAFDNVPIHIPSEYMFVIEGSTYGNSDNVSGHPLDRVRKEVEKLVKEFPDRLTLASTGGPVTGRDEEDRAVWQSNTRKLRERRGDGRRIQPVLSARRRWHMRRRCFAECRTDGEDH